MPRIQNPVAALPGVPRENSFHVLDDDGTRCGSATVVEYINYALLPERPLNYYVSIGAQTERAFDLLVGASLARAIELRRRHARLAARIYAPVKPQDHLALSGLMEYGFHNDDALIRMRKVAADSVKLPQPPIACFIAPILLETEDDCQALLSRINRYSVAVHTMDWLLSLQREPLFTAFGVWQDDRLLGEMVLSAYGAEGRLEALYVEPSQRRRGVGSALVGHALKILMDNGVRALSAEVWRRNLPSMALATALQFESVSPVLLYPGVNI